MSDLIERQAAIDAMANTIWHYPNKCYRNLNEYEFAQGLAELGLKSVPSTQSEIIHCKDCKYYNDHTEECDNDKGLRFLDYSNLDLMHCAWAERREG